MWNDRSHESSTPKTDLICPSTHGTTLRNDCLIVRHGWNGVLECYHFIQALLLFLAHMEVCM